MAPTLLDRFGVKGHKIGINFMRIYMYKHWWGASLNNEQKKIHSSGAGFVTPSTHTFFFLSVFVCLFVSFLVTWVIKIQWGGGNINYKNCVTLHIIFVLPQQLHTQKSLLYNCWGTRAHTYTLTWTLTEAASREVQYWVWGKHMEGQEQFVNTTYRLSHGKCFLPRRTEPIIST